MGGDFAPRAIVEGAVEAARTLDVEPVLVGAGDRIMVELRRLRTAPSLEIVEAPEFIEMHEHPAMALRRKRGASIIVAMQAAREGRVAAVVSAGHTGAAIGAAQLILGRAPGIDRPAIAAVLPTAAGRPIVLLDVGATVDCTPQQLAQFGLMGGIYAREVLGVASPRVGLLSNGEEETKGNDLTIRAAEILRGMPLAFVGNVVLKLGEGVVRLLREISQSEFGGWQGRLWQFYLIPARGRLRRIWRRLDYREYGGAPLLGVNGVCVIGHGRSNAQAVRNAIRVAAESARHGLPGLIASAAMLAAEPHATLAGS